MTQVATPSTVLGTFDDVVLEDRFRYQFVRRDDEIWVEMPDPLWFENPPWFMELLDPNWPQTPLRIEARVVMATGSHHMQNYWIRRPDGGEGSLGPDDGALVQLPSKNSGSWSLMGSKPCGVCHPQRQPPSTALDTLAGSSK